MKPPTKKKVVFLRQQSRRRKLENNWRAPRGGESKLRKRRKGRMIPSIGYSLGNRARQFIIKNVIVVMRKLNKFPTFDELRVEKHNNPEFPGGLPVDGLLYFLQQRNGNPYRKLLRC